jgi:tetratricopeptide (TPR) repeat protein
VTDPDLPGANPNVPMPASTNLPRKLLLAAALAVACDSAAAPAGTPPPAPAPAEVEPVATADAALTGQHVQRSIELEKAGDLAAARTEAEAALAAGGGRDATIQAAKVAILDKRYDDAVALLEPLAKSDPQDAGAQYNLALSRHHQGDYNRARGGYLAALRADDSYADARYNLAVLCRDHGFAEEASHHASRFRTDYPADPRGVQISQLVGGAGAPQLDAPPANTPPSPTPSPAPR